MNIPDDLTIREAGMLLRRGDCTAVDLTTAALGRIAATEPRVNAFVKILRDSALDAAEQADIELRSGRDRGPLHGIPMAVKDLFDLTGTVTGCGSHVRDDALEADTDADAVAQLRGAGVILLGKTVTHEFAAGVQCPPTRNPWDTRRIPGGSSGGSAAAVAVGSCLGALSSDTAGSVRVPASLCGVAGVKPTRGRVSTRGAFPLAWSVDTVGTHARTIDDAMLILSAISERHRLAQLSESQAGLQEGNLRGIRIGVIRPYFFDHVETDVEAAVSTALEVMTALGAKVVQTPWSESEAAAAAGLIIIRSEMAAVHAETLRSVPEKYGAVLRARLEGFSVYPVSGYLRARQVRTVVRQSMAKLFASQNLDAVIMPTTAATAPFADQVRGDADGQDRFHGGFFRLTVPFNATGQPAISIPCGIDSTGLPIGLQVAAAPWEERVLWRIGHAFEHATSWSKQRPPL